MSTEHLKSHEKHSPSSSTAVITVDSEVGTVVAEEAKPQPPQFPEGGWAAWRTLLGAALVQFCTFGYVNAFGVYQGDNSFADYYVREYLKDYTASDIGWIGGIQICLVFSSGVFTGRLFDRGYFHHLMIAGAILFVFSFFMLSITHESKYYQVFLSHGLGGGLGAGMVYIPSLAVVSHYFHRNRPLAMGVVATGSAMGAMLHPIMLNKFFNGHIGFHTGVRISAAFNTGLLVIANLLMRTRLPPKKVGSAFPLKTYAKDLPYLFIMLGGMVFVCGLFFPIFFLQLDAITHGVNSNIAFYSIPILNASSMFGRTIPNFLGTRFGVLNVMTIFIFSMTIMIFCMLAVKTEGAVAAFAVIFGFLSGGGISLLPPVLASMAKDVSEIGSRIGVFFAFCGIFGLVATPIAGALLSVKFHWWRPIIFAGTTMLVAGLLFSTARFLLVKRRGKQFV